MDGLPSGMNAVSVLANYKPMGSGMATVAPTVALTSGGKGKKKPVASKENASTTVLPENTLKTPDGKPIVKRPFVKDGRENWNKFLEMPVETDKNQKLKDIIYKVSKATGVRPEVLFTSAMEEGLQGAGKGGKISFDKDDKGQYIDSYAWLGLDNVGTDIDNLSKEGYLNKDISYQPYKRMNDAKNPQEVNPAYFDSLEDSLYVKAALLNKNRDAVNKYATSNGIKLSDDAADFISMQSYNAGQGIIPKAFEKYKNNNLLQGESFLTTPPAGGYEENPSYYNTRKRYDNMKYLQDLGAFSDYNKPTVATTTTTM